MMLDVALKKHVKKPHTKTINNENSNRAKKKREFNSQSSSLVASKASTHRVKENFVEQQIKAIRSTVN